LETNTHTEAPILNWTAPVSPTPERGHTWYIVVGVLIVGCLLFSLVTQAWTFTIVIILTSGAYWRVHKQAEPIATISILETGAQLNKTYVPWSDCEGFWLLQFPTYVELHIGRKTPRKAPILIQTGTMDVSVIRKTLVTYIPEISDRQERLLDFISRICKI